VSGCRYTYKCLTLLLIHFPGSGGRDQDVIGKVLKNATHLHQKASSHSLWSWR